MTELIETLRRFLESEALLREIWNNSLADYVIAFIALAVFLLVFKLIQMGVLHRLRRLAERTKTDIDDALVRIVNTVKPPFYSFIAFYFAITLFLELNSTVQRVMTMVLIVWVVYQAINAVQVLIDFIAHKALAKQEDESAKVATDIIGKIAKIILWTVGLLLILSNFGININSLIAGLGIGGIAIAFALQSILSDLFSSFAIYFDKPFAVGDYIVVSDTSKGTVERIGIKTTRLRSLGGEELVISNQELTSVRLQNFKQMEERRVVFELGIVYETSGKKLRAIPDIIGDIFNTLDKARFDRAHFTRFDNFALIFEVVYFVETPEYPPYMDVKQELNFRIKDEFEKYGIEMAYPTQTIYLSGGNE